LHAAPLQLARIDQFGPSGTARQTGRFDEFEVCGAHHAAFEYRRVEPSGRGGLGGRIGFAQCVERGGARAMHLPSGIGDG
jgi:hypothetical protein